MGGVFNKMTWRSFVIYFLCLSLPMFIMLSALIFSGVEREEYLQNAEAQTQMLSARLAEKMDVIFNTANSIFQTQWFKHYSVQSGAYDSEFNVIKRIEICNDLKTMVTSMQFAASVLVIIPSRDVVICETGWSTISEYMSFYGLVNIAYDTVTNRAAVSPKEDGSYVVITLDNIKTEYDIRSVSVLLDKALFARYIGHYDTENMQYLQISVGGQSIYEDGIRGEGHFSQSDSRAFPFVSVRAEHTAYQNHFISRNPFRFALQMMVTLLLSLLLALLLVYRNTRPLSQLLKRLPGAEARSTNEAYRSLDRYVETISSENRQLSTENESLNTQMQRMFGVFKNEIVFKMLTDPDFDFHNEYIRSAMPWLAARLPYVMVLAATRDGQSGLSDAVLRQMGQVFAHCQYYRLFGGEYCILFWFDSREEAEARRDALGVLLAEKLGSESVYALSPVHEEPEELREAYLALKERLGEREKAWMDLPISLQIELITKIQNNRFEASRDIIMSARGHYRPALFLSLLLRLAGEYGVDSVSFAHAYKNQMRFGSEEALWNLLISFSSDICKGIQAGRRKGMGDSYGIIRRYIDEHYSDPEISIKLLSERFELDGSLISRIFKAQAGVSFTDYLLELRMKKAIELMGQGESSLTAIAESVGYVNYFSFKRAFIRYQGISPKEYRMLRV